MVKSLVFAAVILSASSSFAQGLVIPAIALSAVQGLDLHSTHRAVTSGAGIEGNAVMGAGTGARVVATKAVATASAIGIAALLERNGHRKMARISLWSATGAISVVAARNYRIASGVRR